MTLPVPFAVRCSLLGAAALLTGCAAGPGAVPETPRYNPSAGAAAQAASFTRGQHLQKAAPAARVGLTRCNVLFATRTGASASTSAGVFDTSARMEAKVSAWYELKDFDDAQMQALTTRICDQAEARLATAGYRVVPRAELAAVPAMAPYLDKGKPSPLDWKSPAKTEYRVFAPPGLSVQGYGNAMADAFAVAKGESVLQLEFLAGRAGGFVPLQLSVLVDFASVASDGSKALGGWASKNDAEVKGAVSLTLSGSLTQSEPALFECMPRLGKEYCYQKDLQLPQVLSSLPLASEAAFYREIADVESTLDKVGEGVANVIGILGGTSSYAQSKQGVFVLPEVYASTAEALAADFVTMAASQLPR